MDMMMSSLDLNIPNSFNHTADLPQEIVDLVVDLVAELSPNRRAALHVCNAVSRSFHSRAQQRLFEAIDFVVDFSASNRAHRLRRVLEAKPELTSLIRSFKVIIQEPRYLMEVLQPLKKRFFKKPAGSLIQELGVFGSKEHFWWLLQTITSVQVVNFSLVAPDGKDVNWSSLSETSQSLFLAIRSSLRLKSLEVANISCLTNRVIIGTDPQNGLARQDSLPLQNLIVRNCRLETSSTVVFDIPSIAVPFRHLKTLDLTEFNGPQESGNFLNELQSTLDMDSTNASQSFHFPALTKLATSLDCYDTRSTQSVQNLVTSCRKTIKCLKLYVQRPEADPINTKLALPRMRGLQDLCIEVKALNADITQPYLRFITRILRSASTPSSSSPTNLLQALETIQLSIELESGNGREVQAAFGWEDLDKVIVNQTAFPNLKEVIIALKIEQLHCYGSDHRPSSCKLIDAKNVLPLTSLSNRISIHVRNPAPSDLDF